MAFSSGEMCEKDKIKNYPKNRLDECEKNTHKLRNKYWIVKIFYGTTIVIIITYGTVIAGLFFTTIPPLKLHYITLLRLVPGLQQPGPARQYKYQR